MLLGGTLLVRADISARRDAFRNEAQALHRLMRERMAQHEAILSMLALQQPRSGSDQFSVPLGLTQIRAAWFIGTAAGQPPSSDTSAAPPLAQLGPMPTVPSHFLSTFHLAASPGSSWRYWLVLRQASVAHALLIEPARLREDPQWPAELNPTTRVVLHWPGQVPLPLQPGPPTEARPWGWTNGFRFEEDLAATHPGLRLHISQAVGPAQWPWAILLAWTALWSLLVMLAHSVWRTRQEHHRTAQLMRLARVARLNTLGEMAAGLAHELNQPLAAALTGIQTATRLLADEDDDPAAPPGTPQSPGVAQALGLATAQVRRAADVVARLRRLVQAPQAAAVYEPVELETLIHRLVDWMHTDIERLGVRITLEGSAPVFASDRVALEQVFHNLLTNALQALSVAPVGAREIHIQIETVSSALRCTICDSGPGLSTEARQRLFEPFYTTRSDGLGLGLSLSQSLIQGLGGSLEAAPGAGPGTCLIICLPHPSAIEIRRP